MIVTKQNGLSRKSIHKTRAIIPAAGFGTRVGSPAAKELLEHPIYHKKMIEVCLKRCEEHALEPLVVTRAEKTSLIEFLETHHPFVDIQIIQPSREWMDTVLQSEPFWFEKKWKPVPTNDSNQIEFVLLDSFRDWAR